MRVTIAAVGRDRTGPTRDLFDDYSARCPWPIRLVEVTARPNLPEERRIAEESSRLLQAVPDGAVVLVLDERGQELDSEGLSARISQWQDQGRRELACLIGGPDGLAPVVLERADATLAFGRMTWPHRLVRVMLLEQLYRAAMILAGHPYHRE